MATQPVAVCGIPPKQPRPPGTEGIRKELGGERSYFVKSCCLEGERSYFVKSCCLEGERSYFVKSCCLEGESSYFVEPAVWKGRALTL